MDFFETQCTNRLHSARAEDIFSLNNFQHIQRIRAVSLAIMCHIYRHWHWHRANVNVLFIIGLLKPLSFPIWVFLLFMTRHPELLVTSAVELLVIQLRINRGFNAHLVLFVL